MLSAESMGLLVGIIVSLVYSFVKPERWTKESKEKMSWWLAVMAALGVAFYQKDVTTATLMVLIPTILGTMQVWYKFVAQNMGIEDITRVVKDTVQTKVTDIVKGTAGILANERAVYSDKANGLSKKLLSGELSNEEYKTEITKLNVEYKSLFPGG